MVFHRISLARAHNNNPNYWIIVHGARCPSWICQRCHARFKPFREPKRRLQAQDFMTIPSCLECQPWTTTLGLVNCEGTGYLSRTADESRVDFICVYIYNCWRVQGWFYMYIYIMYIDMYIYIYRVIYIYTYQYTYIYISIYVYHILISHRTSVLSPQCHRASWMHGHFGSLLLACKASHRRSE